MKFEIGDVVIVEGSPRGTFIGQVVKVDKTGDPVEVRVVDGVAKHMVNPNCKPGETVTVRPSRCGFRQPT